MGEAEKKSGTVKWFNATKGFGFITPSEGGEDLFVHQTSIVSEGFRSLKDGEVVEFEIEAAADGRTKAVNVTGPSGQAPQGAPRRSRSSTRGAAVTARGRGRGRGRPMYFYPPYPGYYPGFYYPGRGGRGFRGRGRFGFASRGRGRYQAPPVEDQGEPSGYQVVVHNLPWNYTWKDLKNYFKEWKVERADIINDSWTGRSKGFGTVRFATKEDSESACQKLNNTEVDGRTITVRLDRYA